MAEPRLEDISDYDTLKGSKKKVVWSVIVVGIVLSILYTFAAEKFDGGKENIKVQESIKTIPVK